MVENRLQVCELERLHDIHHKAGKLVDIAKLVFRILGTHASLDPREQHLNRVEKRAVRGQVNRDDSAFAETTSNVRMSMDLGTIHDPNGVLAWIHPTPSGIRELVAGVKKLMPRERAFSHHHLHDSEDVDEDEERHPRKALELAFNGNPLPNATISARANHAAVVK